VVRTWGPVHTNVLLSPAAGAYSSSSAEQSKELSRAEQRPFATAWLQIKSGCLWLVSLSPPLSILKKKNRKREWIFRFSLDFFCWEKKEEI
jgi:hypothetical protein